MSRIVCGCSKVVQRLDDGKNQEIVGECEICALTGDYSKSPDWKELIVIPETTVKAVRDKYNKGKKK